MKRTFAIIGCGRIAERHAEHISRLGELRAVCDIDPKRLTMFTEKYGVAGYLSIEEFISARPEVDVVSVCTPNGLHASQAITLLREGYNVLVEKPMALSVRDCERMILEAEKAGRKLFVVKQNRFNPPVVYLRKILDDAKIGRILSVQLNCFWNRNEAYYKGSPWKGTKKLDGGALFTQFSHFIDLLLWLAGDVKHIGMAYVENVNHPYIEIDDQGVAIFKLENGAIGTMNYSTNAYGKNVEGSITIFGEKGTIKIGGEYLNVLEFVSIEGVEIPVLPKGNAANNYGAYTGSMSNHDKVYENVVAVLDGQGTISTSGIEGMKTVKFIEDVYKSADYFVR